MKFFTYPDGSKETVEAFLKRIDEAKARAKMVSQAQKLNEHQMRRIASNYWRHKIGCGTGVDGSLWANINITQTHAKSLTGTDFIFGLERYPCSIPSRNSWDSLVRTELDFTNEHLTRNADKVARQAIFSFLEMAVKLARKSSLRARMQTEHDKTHGGEDDANIDLMFRWLMNINDDEFKGEDIYKFLSDVVTDDRNEYNSPIGFLEHARTDFNDKFKDVSAPIMVQTATGDWREAKLTKEEDESGDMTTIYDPKDKFPLYSGDNPRKSKMQDKFLNSNFLTVCESFVECRILLQKIKFVKCTPNRLGCDDIKDFFKLPNGEYDFQTPVYLPTVEVKIVPNRTRWAGRGMPRFIAERYNVRFFCQKFETIEPPMSSVDGGDDYQIDILGDKGEHKDEEEVETKEAQPEVEVGAGVGLKRTKTTAGNSTNSKKPKGAVAAA